MDEEMFKVNELLCEILEKVKDKNPLMKALYLENKVDIKRLELPMKLEKNGVNKIREIYTGRRRVLEQNKRNFGG